MADTHPVPTDWLLDGPPWIERLVRRDLMGAQPGDARLKDLRLRGLTDPPVAEWLKLLEEWPGPALKSHKTLSLLLHKLDFLTDIGLYHKDIEAAGVAEAILIKASPEGPFRLPILLPKAFGGSGLVEDLWMLTDAPVLIGALAKMGLADRQEVIRAAVYVAGLTRENGWLCAASPELGRFQGPGRKDDPCPYANLISLRMLSDCGMAGDCSSRGIRDVHYPSTGIPGKESMIEEAALRGIESLLLFWNQRREKKLRMFGIGTDFMKLKAPFVWFDILHFLEVLSRFPAARRDTRYREILEIAENQGDDEGRYMPASIYRPAASFDFGNKKEASRWISFIMARISRRMNPDK